VRQKQTAATAGYGERLARALQRGPKPMSVRALAELVGQRFGELRGASYGGIRQYAEGKVRHPRIDLLRAIAEVLGVRSDWLAFGEGSMTEDEEQARRAEPELRTPLDKGGDWIWEAVRDGVRAGFGKGADWIMAIDGERVGARGAVIGRTWRVLLISPAGKALAQRQGRGKARGKGAPYRTAFALGRMLREPFVALQLDPTSVPDDLTDDYVFATCAALRHLAYLPIESAPEADHAEEA
jgi:transcriptional regulator with XRE-family HTH domain